MKKILLAFDGHHFSEGAFDWVRRLHALQPVLVTGVFLPLVDYASLWSYAQSAATGPLPVIPGQADDEHRQVQENIARFERLCGEAGIEYRVHQNFFEFALPELRRETRFADLLILSSEQFYHGAPDDSQFSHLKSALKEAECPVLITPEHFDWPDHNVLAYDGSAESVYAIKQFAYLFPELTRNHTVLVHAGRGGGDALPGEPWMEELSTMHYSDLRLMKLESDSRNAFARWVHKRPGALLVCGSFHRSALSEMIRESFVAGIIRAHKLPVFVAHR
ncbi:MAG: hypothetical protein EOO11_00025 [Chitinophagaceae bacterium]|nr:MAG: hypothetical protein EOO11_00025 [Chitinophagaceae bacterium]